jgi:hypothetical protein
MRWPLGSRRHPKLCLYFDILKNNGGEAGLRNASYGLKQRVETDAKVPTFYDLRPVIAPPLSTLLRRKESIEITPYV